MRLKGLRASELKGDERTHALLEILIDVQLNVYEELVQIDKDLPGG